MAPLIVLLCIIGVIALLSKFLPNIIASIPAFIGLITLILLIGGVLFVLTI